jgi:hypothetical protein
LHRNAFAALVDRFLGRKFVAKPSTTLADFGD